MLRSFLSQTVAPAARAAYRSAAAFAGARSGAAARFPQAWLQHVRCASGRTEFDLESHDSSMRLLRNIGISAHIDSGKTTLTERVLFYTGRIDSIHEVRGRDGVGATMDSMDLEREKGITIQSAATFCAWGDHRVNIIDTPGHVDFTVEVERALRVLDGAVLVLCGVGGVQSQSITVDRQMKRYNVPRLCFINKLDRMGANPWKVIKDLRGKLQLNATAVQLPIGLEEKHEGVVDLISMKAYYNEGEFGEIVAEREIPSELMAQAEEKRHELIERLGEVDEEVAELFLMEEPVPEPLMREAIRRQTIANTFVPVFMGSAFKNRGVQRLLDGVVDFLPSPMDVKTVGLDVDDGEKEVALACDSTKPLVALAFKLEESRYGQLTYMRIYQGHLKRAENIFNVKNGKKVKVPRLVRMHADKMEDIEGAGAGEILAMFGVDCSSGDTFTDGTHRVAMQSMFVPEPVMSLAVKPKDTQSQMKFSKALNRFTKEDPTFKLTQDPDTKETIISGMGELHLEIYVERMKREYGAEVVVGKPRVNFRETCQARGEFDYLHKKQSGGQGQYGRVIGYVEPLPEDYPEDFEFVNELLGNNIPPEFVSACEKGFREACEKGGLTGHPVQRVRVVLTDGASHAVDSSEIAFRLAAMNGFRQGFRNARPTVLEPIMSVGVSVPTEYQGNVIAGLNRRKGSIMDNATDETGYCSIEAEVPLSEMFGYSTDLRSATQGKGEFAMEYKRHAPVPQNVVQELMKAFQESRAKKGEDAE
eukprot:CAMPEP_0196773170 /NCGR_PEP_ID=MMETSP1104-20130614/2620_1 /TAXON_ID=33652 /ORGANISM="Cafeteria sp., Strain Caron Lab Isolate" /LENGTH=759 /DNA_ID=CAMNT_0042143315 /DNA_START=1 /DNA_END=2280 /DNA_ORIENTATION=+